MIKLCQNIVGVRFSEAQSPLFQVCQVAPVVMETAQLILSQFKKIVN